MGSTLPPERTQGEEKMKKILALFLALTLALSLVACGGSTETEEQIAAREVDTAVWKVVTTASDALQTLTELVADTTDETGIDALRVMIDVLRAKQDSLDNIPADTQPAILYIGAARAYTANARVIYENIYAFIVNGDTKSYERFEKYSEMVSDLTNNSIEKRKDFLAAAGFSESDIADFPAEIRDD